jgi:flagellin
MGFSITFNPSGRYAAGFADRNMMNAYRSLQRLSSGLRINSAADAPAELVISERLRSQIAGLSQKIENTSANISKYQTASSELSEMRSQLTDIRTLAVGAANEAGNSEAAQAAYAATAGHIVDRYNETIKTATYNGAELLDGSEGSVAEVKPLESVDLSTAESAQASIETIDKAINELDEQVVKVGATQRNDLESQMQSLEITRQNLIAAESQLRDTDYAAEFSSFVRGSIQTRASMAMQAHSRLNAEVILGILKA